MRRASTIGGQLEQEAGASVDGCWKGMLKSGWCFDRHPGQSGSNLRNKVQRSTIALIFP